MDAGLKEKVTEYAKLMKKERISHLEVDGIVISLAGGAIDEYITKEEQPAFDEPKQDVEDKEDKELREFILGKDNLSTNELGEQYGINS